MSCMMNKKELLLAVLNKLMSYWEMAEGFSVFVNDENCSKESIDNLAQYISHCIQKIKKENLIREQKNALDRGIQQKNHDIEEAETLLDNLLIET